MIRKPSQPMRLQIVPKNALSPEQLRYLDARLAAPEHDGDGGPPRVWNKYTSSLYAFVHEAFNFPIAIAEASGRPIATPGWWIDSEFRGQGYGNELVDLLAGYLAADGVTGIGPIIIDTRRCEYDEQSTKLARRFRARFDEARAG